MIMKTVPSRPIRRAKRGDTKAFSVLYSRNYTDMYRFALYMLGSPHDAEDAVSDTVISAYEGITRLRKDESFRSWIFTILSNRCLENSAGTQPGRLCIDSGRCAAGRGKKGKGEGFRT